MASLILNLVVKYTQLQSGRKGGAQEQLMQQSLGGSRPGCVSQGRSLLVILDMLSQQSGCQSLQGTPAVVA